MIYQKVCLVREIIKSYKKSVVYKPHFLHMMRMLGNPLFCFYF